MQASPPPPAGAFPHPPPTHGLATASVITGLLSCCCWGVGPIIAIVCGVIALGQIRDYPDQYGGRQTAIVGTVLGVGQLIVQAVAFIVLIAVGVNEDRITALVETPPAEVFTAENLPADGESFLLENGYVESDEQIVLYYDDSFMEKFAALSVLTDRRVLTVFDGEAESIALHEVHRVRYVAGSFAEDYMIYVQDGGGRSVNLVFTVGADVQGFAEEIATLAKAAGGPADLQVE